MVFGKDEERLAVTAHKLKEHCGMAEFPAFGSGDGYHVTFHERLTDFPLLKFYAQRKAPAYLPYEYECRRLR